MKRIISFISFLALLISLVSTVALADAATYDMEMADYYVYVTTPDGGLNMRYGPGTEYDKVMEERIPDGVRLHIEMVSGNWGYTTFLDNYGWVALKQTSPAPYKLEPKPQEDSEQADAPEVKQETESVAEENDDPAVGEPVEEREPQIISEPYSENSEVDTDDFNTTEKSGGNPISSQMFMIAILILLVIALALVVVIVVNLNSRK